MLDEKTQLLLEEGKLEEYLEKVLPVIRATLAGRIDAFCYERIDGCLAPLGWKMCTWLFGRMVGLLVKRFVCCSAVAFLLFSFLQILKSVVLEEPHPLLLRGDIHC